MEAQISNTDLQAFEPEFSRPHPHSGSTAIGDTPIPHRDTQSANRMHEENLGLFELKEKFGMHQKGLAGSSVPRRAQMVNPMVKKHEDKIQVPYGGLLIWDKMQVPEELGKSNNSGGPVEGSKDTATESRVMQIQDRFTSHRYKLQQPSSDLCIYRVPATIRDPKPKAYVPLISSCGPYHHHKQDQLLSAMDDYKLEAVHRFLKRFQAVRIHNLIAEAGKLEEKIRSCYEDSAIEYNKLTLAWMFTMDACFILEFFFTLHTEQVEEEHINLFFQYNGCQNIFRWEIIWDILKLEKQIPLSIIILILKLGFKDEKIAVSKLVELLVPYKQFRGFPFSLALSEGKLKSRLKEHIQNGGYHLLALSRRVITDFLIDSNSPTASAITDSAKLSFTASANIGSAKCSFTCCTPDFTPRDDCSIPSAEKLDE